MGNAAPVRSELPASPKPPVGSPRRLTVSVGSGGSAAAHTTQRLAAGAAAAPHNGHLREGAGSFGIGAHSCGHAQAVRCSDYTCAPRTGLRGR
ncbi:MAG: hypothetical protein DWI67_08895 [Chloroflexi bacterium]|nr:MAG: hypothetical protein DWI64_06110 [Chloroflexota bacterium]RLT50726.1 MAG: hypothetical protein DWI67_08895 [Chloroflexota bacterium]